MNDELLNALEAGYFDRAAELLRAGADINALTVYEKSLLQEVILHVEGNAERHTVVSFMLGHGADPRLHNADSGGPLFAAVINQDTDVLRLLLDHGADPNRENDGCETLYDWAEFDYRYEVYDCEDFPEQPTEEDKASPDAWLRFLDRIAVKHGLRRPDYLILLRERGALTRAERERQQGGPT